MSRTLSTAALKAVYAQDTSDAFIVLLTIDHENLADPVRVCSNALTITSRGDDYIAFPFELILPDETENQSPRARLVIDNVSQEISVALKQIDSAPSVKIEIIRAADADVVEAVFPDFKLTNVKYDALTVQGDLTLEDFTAEPYPATVFSPSVFPGIF